MAMNNEGLCCTDEFTVSTSSIDETFKIGA